MTVTEQAQLVLDRLQRGPATTVELQRSLPLVHVAKQIYDLREAGWDIETTRLPNRVARYRLLGRAKELRQAAVFGDPVLIREMHKRGRR